MQKSFQTQPELFVASVDIDHPALHELDATEAVLDWNILETLIPDIYASPQGWPSYPLQTLLRGLLLGVWYNFSMCSYHLV